PSTGSPGTPPARSPGGRSRPRPAPERRTPAPAAPPPPGGTGSDPAPANRSRLPLPIRLPGLAEELRVLVVQCVEAGGVLHVVGELVGHGGEDLVLPGLLVLAGQEGGKGAVVQYDVPPQHVVAVLPHNVHLSRGKLRVGEGLLLQLDAPVQLLKKRVREFLGDLLQPVPHGLIAGHHIVRLLSQAVLAPPLYHAGRATASPKRRNPAAPAGR